MEIVCGFVFADVIFRRSEATAGNTSAFAGYARGESTLKRIQSTRLIPGLTEKV